MPLYDWKCEHCGLQVEVLRSMREALEPVFCTCGVPMVQQLSAAYVSADIAPYKAVAGDRAGKWITSRREHREFLKRNRLVELGNEKPKDTSQMRKTVKRGEIAREIKATTEKLLTSDPKGGLIERNARRS